jgi:DNA/RNA endonuclease YhcR with UshA esterase domain
VSQNLYTIRFHTDQPKRHKCEKLSIIISNKGSVNEPVIQRGCIQGKQDLFSTINTVFITSGGDTMRSDDDDGCLIKLQREVLQNLISTQGMQISQICGISKENTHEKNTYFPMDLPPENAVH